MRNYSFRVIIFFIVVIKQYRQPDRLWLHSMWTHRAVLRSRPIFKIVFSSWFCLFSPPCVLIERGVSKMMSLLILGLPINNAQLFVQLEARSARVFQSAEGLSASLKSACANSPFHSSSHKSCPMRNWLASLLRK